MPERPGAVVLDDSEEVFGQQAANLRHLAGGLIVLGMTLHVALEKGQGLVGPLRLAIGNPAGLEEVGIAIFVVFGKHGEMAQSIIIAFQLQVAVDELFPERCVGWLDSEVFLVEGGAFFGELRLVENVDEVGHGAGVKGTAVHQAPQQAASLVELPQCTGLLGHFLLQGEIVRPARQQSLGRAEGHLPATETTQGDHHPLEGFLRTRSSRLQFKDMAKIAQCRLPVPIGHGDGATGEEIVGVSRLALEQRLHDLGALAIVAQLQEDAAIFPARLFQLRPDGKELSVGGCCARQIALGSQLPSAIPQRLPLGRRLVLAQNANGRLLRDGGRLRPGGADTRDMQQEEDEEKRHPALIEQGGDHVAESDVDVKLTSEGTSQGGESVA